ncbi:hypothetical protein KSD_42600 [Ktedonobacter sp. SOSP1-85]|nr:hypothetical protein KSD_42600 [Ktedonobacter sp. SOSP1-85]
MTRRFHFMIVAYMMRSKILFNSALWTHDFITGKAVVERQALCKSVYTL